MLDILWDSFSDYFICFRFFLYSGSKAKDSVGTGEFVLSYITISVVALSVFFPTAPFIKQQSNFSRAGMAGVNNVLINTGNGRGLAFNLPAEPTEMISRLCILCILCVFACSG